MAQQPPFALFVLSEVDSDYIIDSLNRAWKGNFEAVWGFWVATDKYSEAPHFKENGMPSEGSRSVTTDFTSPWIGRTVEDCARWLRDAPSEVAVDREVFEVIDEYSKTDDTFQTCRVRQSSDSDDIKVEFFPQPTDRSLMEMITNIDLKFDEKAMNYQRTQKRLGLPDRSRISPYQ